LTVVLAGLIAIASWIELYPGVAQVLNGPLTVFGLTHTLEEAAATAGMAIATAHAAPTTTATLRPTLVTPVKLICMPPYGRSLLSHAHASSSDW
jgi:hypothetical protein